MKQGGNDSIASRLWDFGLFTFSRSKKAALMAANLAFLYKSEWEQLPHFRSGAEIARELSLPVFGAFTLSRSKSAA